MTTVTDPRTGETALITDGAAYFRDLEKRRPPCKHEHIEPRLFDVEGGAKGVWNQCQACGRRMGNALPNSRPYPRSDPNVAITYEANYKRVGDEVAAQHIDLSVGESEEWWAKYTAYLETPAWLQRRFLVIKRCGGVCEGCGSAEVDEVHHLTYEHVTEEFLFELVGLCGNCHHRIHDHTPDGDGPF
jgi:hypothetical protein